MAITSIRISGNIKPNTFPHTAADTGGATAGGVVVELVAILIISAGAAIAMLE